MKTKKFLMLLAAVLLSCASAMAQNSPLKGDVNGDGKVDVADIVAILEIMKNGTKELQSIKWASTTAVNGTTGATPSLGDITLTYNDGTTGTVAYNASGVTLYADAAGNTPFSNANPGTFNVWAKYCGMMTTNSKQVTLSAPVAGTYYWYVGQTQPTSQSSVTAQDSGTFTNNNWHTINVNTTYTFANPIYNSESNPITGDSNTNWYVALPADKSYGIYDSDDVNEVTAGNITKLSSSITVSNVTYNVYKTVGTYRKFNGWWIH